ncbi:MAG: hypothetical protein M5U25_06710 [Planctomycetota bacterium]|nr:hypothetical protein [Planctomycetota bacterium]
MTYRYEWNPMPHKVAVRCPDCGREATFEAATCVRIALKKDVPFFKRHQLFDYKFVIKPNERYHVAIYYPGLHGTGTAPIDELPEGYTAEDFGPPQYWHEYGGHRLGTLICISCGLRRKHDLKWPGEAFYQVMVRGEVLWAYDREYAVVLRDFLASTDRNQDRFKKSLFLDVIPTHFLTAKVRDEAVAKLDKLLQGT